MTVRQSTYAGLSFSCENPHIFSLDRKWKNKNNFFFHILPTPPSPPKKNLVNLNFAEMSKLLKSGLPTKGYSLNNPAKLNFSSFLEFAKFGHF